MRGRNRKRPRADRYDILSYDRIGKYVSSPIGRALSHQIGGRLYSAGLELELL
jgi:hypothetical protein